MYQHAVVRVPQTLNARCREGHDGLNAGIKQTGGDARGEVGALSLDAENSRHSVLIGQHRVPSVPLPARDADHICRAPDRAAMFGGEVHQSELHRCRP